MSSRYARRVAGTALAAALLAVVLPLQAAVTPEQTEQANEATQMLKEAGERALSGDFEGAKRLVVEAHESVKKIQGDGKDAAVNKLVAPLSAAIKARARFLTAHGISVPGMEQPQAAMASTPGPGRPTPGTPAPASGAVSFMNQVAPIFLQRCNNCHVTGTRGNFSMASFSAMMRGANGIEMISPGKGADSRLIEVLESGDMPRGGGPLPKDQIALISKWIDEGAKFDGPDANAPLTGLVPRPDSPRLEVKTATGRETVKFARDIAPVIASQCLDCHAGGQPSAQLGLDTFERMLAGNRNGAIIAPGKAADSQLIKKLKGEAGQRMPLRKAPLSDETIAKFEKWISEGATFDGSDAKMSVARVAAIYAAGQMTHEELAQARVNDAQRNWRLANPDVTPDQVETANFLLMGNVGEDRLREIGDVAEKLVPRLASIFKLPADKPLLKGRLTIFVVNRRFEYSEFGRMVERREMPGSQRGHFRFTITDAYACIYPPQVEGEGSLEPLIAEQIAGVLVESCGEVPEWFSQGSAWEVASRFGPKDRLTLDRDNYVSGAASKMTKADDFLTGKLTPLDASVLNYSFAKFLMGRSNSARYQQLLNALKGGAKFDQAFRAVYGGTPNQLAAAWASSAR